MICFLPSDIVIYTLTQYLKSDEFLKFYSYYKEFDSEEKFRKECNIMLKIKNPPTLKLIRFRKFPKLKLYIIFNGFYGLASFSPPKELDLSKISFYENIHTLYIKANKIKYIDILPYNLKNLKLKHCYLLKEIILNTDHKNLEKITAINCPNLKINNLKGVNYIKLNNKKSI